MNFNVYYNGKGVDVISSTSIDQAQRHATSTNSRPVVVAPVGCSAAEMDAAISDSIKFAQIDLASVTALYIDPERVLKLPVRPGSFDHGLIINAKDQTVLRIVGGTAEKKIMGEVVTALNMHDYLMVTLAGIAESKDQNGYDARQAIEAVNAYKALL